MTKPLSTSSRSKINVAAVRRASIIIPLVILVVGVVYIQIWVHLPSLLPPTANQEHQNSKIMMKDKRQYLNINDVCPNSLNINSQNNHSPPSQLMSVEEIENVIKYWYTYNCPRKSSCTFASIGQHLLHLVAIQRNETLLTCNREE